jgi:hypothetical protein
MVRRESAGQTYSADMVGRVFAAKPGETVVGEDTRLGFVVAKLDKVATDPPGQLALLVETQREPFRNTLFADLAQGTRNAGRAAVQPKINYASARTALGLEPEAPVKAAVKK